MKLGILPLLLLALVVTSECTVSNSTLIDRKAIVALFNPTRNATSPPPNLPPTSPATTPTPMQIGNGNFAFGTDLTSLQTFIPFNTLSSWGWKNDSLPPNTTEGDVDAYHGVSWLSHGRPVQYDFGGANPAIEQWLISNPNRVNLGRVGLLFLDPNGDVLGDVQQSDLQGIKQTLDLWSGTLTSSFTFSGEEVVVKVTCAQDQDVISVEITSTLVQKRRMGAFLDFPWNDGSAKFKAPFVGNFSVPGMHTTSLATVPLPLKSTGVKTQTQIQAEITHTMDKASFFTSLGSNDALTVLCQSLSLHRYTVLHASESAPTSTFSLSMAFRNTSAFQAQANSSSTIHTPAAVFQSSISTWDNFWSESGFVDVMTGSMDPRAKELQRRIVLSRYLMRVNEAGDHPPQESGLANNGWYGKFHMEMYFWHSAHWALWSNWDILHRSSSVYSHFLQGSIHRAQVQQGYPSGVRWPKMTDPSGRSSPGEINNLLIWEQPHPLVFAEYEYRSLPSGKSRQEVLSKWEEVLTETANWMANFAWWNASTGVYDLGPPMYVVSEDTSPNATMNPAFELAYWRFGLQLAEGWMQRLGKQVPEQWTAVCKGLAALPEDADEEGVYIVYEGIEKGFWSDPVYTSNHPALVGLLGWLPPTPGLDVDKAKQTAEKVWASWNVTDFWGWDFPMLAMSAARNGNPSKAVDWLLDPLFTFDDVGMPGGGVQVPTPYFPGAGALLLAVAMMAAGWDGSTRHSPGFPTEQKGWNVRVEGVSKAL